MEFHEDRILALRLQKQFDKENNSTKPSCLDIPGLTPVKDKTSSWKSSEKENIVKPASIIDPSWEYVDPTPDIHAMFMQFNKRFFWQKLDAVEVRWSPRMTKCAGICCYQGRRGLCSVRLSLPLLKLRPRKDLVETLLHEMIHAYLFVTCNNRDRDGHGPEFHKHMYRINKEAGTKISVYHSFHAEVKLYQQHWWRCDGPCQKRPPFFGMVKRAMNRAPGPSDFWWGQHQATCGGKFIKVREPEGYSKKTSGSRNTKGTQPGTPSKHDIRTFFGGKGNVMKPSNGGHNGKPGSKTKPTYGSISKPGPSKTKTPFPNNSSQVNGFPGKGRGGFGGGMLANKGSGTVIVTGRGKSRNTSESELKDNIINPGSSTLPSNFVPFSGKGHTLGIPTVAGDKPWLSRLDKLESSAPKSNPFRDKKPIIPGKRKLWNDNEVESPKKSRDSVACPSCNVLIEEHLLNNHLDSCLNSVFSSDYPLGNVKCAMCNENIDKIDLNSSLDLCGECLKATGCENDGNVGRCPMCDKEVIDDLDRHLEACIAPSLEDSVIVISDDSDDEQSGNDEEPSCPCPCCGTLVLQSLMNIHLDECLSVAFLKDDSEEF